MGNQYSGAGGAGTNCFTLTAGAGTVAGSTNLTGSPCINLVAGTNITLTGALPNEITIASAGGGGGAPTDAQYVVLTADATLTDERILTAGDGVDLVDAGAGASITVSTDVKANSGIVIDTTELSLDLSANSITGTLAVDDGGTGITTAAKGSVLVVNTLDTITVESGVTDGHVLTYDSGADTVGWAAPGAGTINAGNQSEIAYYAAAGTTLSGSADFQFTGTAITSIGNFVTFNQDDAVINAVTDVVLIQHTTSGNAAIGSGAGLQFGQETSDAGANAHDVVGSRIETVWASGTGGSVVNTECFDLVFYNLNTGATGVVEAARMSCTGAFTATTSIAAGTTLSVEEGVAYPGVDTVAVSNDLTTLGYGLGIPPGQVLMIVGFPVVIEFDDFALAGLEEGARITVTSLTADPGNGVLFTTNIGGPGGVGSCSLQNIGDAVTIQVASGPAWIPISTSGKAVFV